MPLARALARQCLRIVIGFRIAIQLVFQLHNSLTSFIKLQSTGDPKLSRVARGRLSLTLYVRQGPTVAVLPRIQAIHVAAVNDGGCLTGAREFNIPCEPQMTVLGNEIAIR